MTSKADAKVFFNSDHGKRFLETNPAQQLVTEDTLDFFDELNYLPVENLRNQIDDCIDEIMLPFSMFNGRDIKVEDKTIADFYTWFIAEGHKLEFLHWPNDIDLTEQLNNELFFDLHMRLMTCDIPNVGRREVEYPTHFLHPAIAWMNAKLSTLQALERSPFVLQFTASLIGVSLLVLIHEGDLHTYLIRVKAFLKEHCTKGKSISCIAQLLVQFKDERTKGKSYLGNTRISRSGNVLSHHEIGSVQMLNVNQLKATMTIIRNNLQGKLWTKCIPSPFPREIIRDINMNDMTFTLKDQISMPVDEPYAPKAYKTARVGEGPEVNVQEEETKPPFAHAASDSEGETFDHTIFTELEDIPREMESLNLTSSSANTSDASSSNDQSGTDEDRRGGHYQTAANQRVPPPRSFAPTKEGAEITLNLIKEWKLKFFVLLYWTTGPPARTVEWTQLNLFANPANIVWEGDDCYLSTIHSKSRVPKYTYHYLDEDCKLLMNALHRFILPWEILMTAVANSPRNAQLIAGEVVRQYAGNCGRLFSRKGIRLNSKDLSQALTDYTGASASASRQFHTYICRTFLDTDDRPGESEQEASKRNSQVVSEWMWYIDGIDGGLVDAFSRALPPANSQPFVVEASSRETRNRDTRALARHCDAYQLSVLKHLCNHRHGEIQSRSAEYLAKTAAIYCKMRNVSTILFIEDLEMLDEILGLIGESTSVEVMDTIDDVKKRLSRASQGLLRLNMVVYRIREHVDFNYSTCPNAYVLQLQNLQPFQVSMDERFVSRNCEDNVVYFNFDLPLKQILRMFCRDNWSILVICDDAEDYHYIRRLIRGTDYTLRYFSRATNAVRGQLLVAYDDSWVTNRAAKRPSPFRCQIVDVMIHYSRKMTFSQYLRDLMYLSTRNAVSVVVQRDVYDGTEDQLMYQSMARDIRSKQKCSRRIEYECTTEDWYFKQCFRVHCEFCRDRVWVKDSRLVQRPTDYGATM